MNLRDIVNERSAYSDLDRLFFTPFEIDAENDFLMMYVLAHNVHQKRYNKSEKLKLLDTQKEIVTNAILGNYASERKIILSYLFHHLKDNGISQKFLRDFRAFEKVRDVESREMWRVYKYIDQKIIAKIWPEYNRDHELIKRSNMGFTNIQNSSEKEKFLEICKKVRQKIWKTKTDFENNKYPPNTVPENWHSYIHPKETHNFAEAINHFDSSFKDY